MQYKSVGYILYILRDPDTFDIRYVGCTGNLEARISRIKKPARSKRSPMAEWIRKLKSQDKEPIVEIVESIGNSRGKALNLEKQWIEELRKYGENLLNVYPKK